MNEEKKNKREVVSVPIDELLSGKSGIRIVPVRTDKNGVPPEFSNNEETDKNE